MYPKKPCIRNLYMTLQEDILTFEDQIGTEILNEAHKTLNAVRDEYHTASIKKGSSTLVFQSSFNERADWEASAAARMITCLNSIVSDLEKNRRANTPEFHYFKRTVNEFKHREQGFREREHGYGSKPYSGVMLPKAEPLQS